jgi:hypothetical protein
MTLYTPNSRTPDTNNLCGSTTTDPLMPCTSGGNLQAVARSRHVGGVHTLMGDGGVRFVSNSVDSGVWSGLGTMDGSEKIGDF